MSHASKGDAFAAGDDRVAGEDHLLAVVGGIEHLGVAGPS
jgi:hypothetical protein